MWCISNNHTILCISSQTSSLTSLRTANFIVSSETTCSSARGNEETGRCASGSFSIEYLDKQSNVMGGPRKIRSRGSWSHIVSKATDA